MFKKNTSGDNSSKGNMDINFNDIIKNPAFEVFIGIVAAYALFKAGQFVYKKFKHSGSD